jgi:predicted ribosome-associated RNA-binding protein Tma20
MDGCLHCTQQQSPATHSWIACTIIPTHLQQLRQLHNRGSSMPSTLLPAPCGQTCSTRQRLSLCPLPTPASKEIIVNRLAGEAVLKGADIFAPGVLACSKGLVPGDLVAVTIAMPGSSPTYSAQTSSTQHDQPGLGQGPGTKAKSSRAARAPFVLNRGCTISEQNAHLLPERTHLHLGVGMAMMSRKEMFRASSGLAIAMQHRVFQVPPCNGEAASPYLCQHAAQLATDAQGRDVCMQACLIIAAGCILLACLPAIDVCIGASVRIGLLMPAACWLMHC